MIELIKDYWLWLHTEHNIIYIIITWFLLGCFIMLCVEIATFILDYSDFKAWKREKSDK